MAINYGKVFFESGRESTPIEDRLRFTAGGFEPLTSLRTELRCLMVRKKPRGRPEGQHARQGWVSDLLLQRDRIPAEALDRVAKVFDPVR